MLCEIEALSGQLSKKVKINPKVEVKQPDIENPKQRYDAKYIPPGGVNVISPIMSMKFNLSKEQLKL